MHTCTTRDSTDDLAHVRVLSICMRLRKSLLENSIDERDCQQHVGSERELSHTFPHRTHNQLQYAYITLNWDLFSGYMYVCTYVRSSAQARTSRRSLRMRRCLDVYARARIQYRLGACETRV